MTGDGYRTRLERMIVLTMTAAGAGQFPAIRLYGLDRIPYLHRNSVVGVFGVLDPKLFSLAVEECGKAK